MENNVGASDRIVRIGVGLALLAVALVVSTGIVATAPVAGIVAAVAGLVLLATGTMRMCPIYRILGVNTCSR